MIMVVSFTGILVFYEKNGGQSEDKDTQSLLALSLSLWRLQYV